MGKLYVRIDAEIGNNRPKSNLNVTLCSPLHTNTLCTSKSCLDTALEEPLPEAILKGKQKQTELSGQPAHSEAEGRKV